MTLHVAPPDWKVLFPELCYDRTRDKFIQRAVTRLTRRDEQRETPDEVAQFLHDYAACTPQADS